MILPIAKASKVLLDCVSKIDAPPRRQGQTPESMFESQLVSQILVAALLALIIGHVMFLRARGLFFAFDPINYFWGGTLVIMIQQPLEYWDQLVSLNGNSAIWINLTLVAAFIGTVFILIGYHLPQGSALAERCVPKFANDLDPTRMRLMAGIIFLLSVFAHYAIIEHAGGWEIWVNNVRSSTAGKVSQYVTILVYLFPYSVMFYLFAVVRSPSYFFETVAAWSLAVLTWLWHIYIGSRSRTIVFAMMFLAIYAIVKKRNPPLLIILMLVPTLWIITQYQAAYRGNFQNLSFNLDRVPLEQVKATILPEALGGDDAIRGSRVSAGLEFNVALTVVRLVPAEVMPSFGYDWLEFFTRPIPKALWRGEKPFPALESWQPIFIRGRLTNAYVGDTQYLGGPAAGWTGFWYRQFGPLGMIIGGIYTGVFFRFLRELYHQDKSNPSKALLFLGLAPIGFLEAAATPTFWIFVIPLAWVVPNLIFIYACRRAKPTAQQRLATNLASVGAKA